MSFSPLGCFSNFPRMWKNMQNIGNQIGYLYGLNVINSLIISYFFKSS